jgi:hypothetical protein
MKYLSLLLALALAALSLSASAQTNLPAPTNRTVEADAAQAKLLAQREEETRTACINGRRFICGRVVQMQPDGLVVDSGYATLMRPPFNQSWVVPGNVSVNRDAAAVEENRAGAPCIGLVFLTDIPKRPAVKLYDYVTIQGYPAGSYTYKPVPGVEKKIRRFAAGVPTAVKLTLESSGKK